MGKIISVDFGCRIESDGLVVFKTSVNDVFTNPTGIDVDELENKITFKKGLISVVFMDIGEEVKSAIVLDGGFDLFELDDNLDLVNHHRFGDFHQLLNSATLKDVLDGKTIKLF